MENTSTLSKRVRTEWQRASGLIAVRVAGLPAWVVLTQLFVGLGWFRAVAEKVIDPGWWSGGVITDFVSDHRDATLAWYEPFIDGIVTPIAPLIALIVVLTQLVAALSLTTGRRLAVGLSAGIFLNLNFMAAGAVTPSAFYLLVQGALALWMAERTTTTAATNRLRLAAVTATFFAAASLPFISTLHPHEVIDDPAIMFVFGGALGAIACLLAGSSARPQDTPPAAATDLTSQLATQPDGAFSARLRERSSI